MKIKLHNNDNSDSAIYSGTLEEIKEQAIEWNSNPLCVVSDKLLGERHGSTF